MSTVNLQTLAQNLNITTLEQLHLYTGMLLNRVNPTVQVLETPTQVQYACQFNVFQIADGTHRALIRTAIEVEPTWTSDRSKKLWMFAKEFGNVQIPTGFLSN